MFGTFCTDNKIKEVSFKQFSCDANKRLPIKCPQQGEVEPYLDKNIWSTLASNIPPDSMGYSKDLLPDSRDIINFVEGSQSILIDTREGIHGELGHGVKDEHQHRLGGHSDHEMVRMRREALTCMDAGPTPSLWEDINSSIQKLDPMHVDGDYSPGHKYRGEWKEGGDPDCGSDDAIKSEPMYLGAEGEGYVNDGYGQVSLPSY
jgi:hypothetical protein